MCELDGIVYTGETTPEPKVTAARATNDWKILVTFPNGKTESSTAFIPLACDAMP